MNEIWANRLIVGTKMWTEMPSMRQAAVKVILNERVKAGNITPEKYKRITGEEYEG